MKKIYCNPNVQVVYMTMPNDVCQTQDIPAIAAGSPMNQGDPELGAPMRVRLYF